MNIFWQNHSLVVVLFLSLGLLTALVNNLTTRRFDQYPPASHYPSLSVLVPARNEAHNIEACISSLLAQDYPDFEVITLDDHSSDDTLPILERLARQDPRLRLLNGRPLPEGWLGKHWACHQLHQAATGDLLLFTDADTRHLPGSLRGSVNALLAEKADLVTAFPHEQVGSWAEKLIMPVISFGIFSFLPIRLARFLRWPSLTVTIGQFMLFRRQAFEAIGGYQAVKHHLVDDVTLGRNLMAQGFEWRLLDGSEQVICRMYHNFNEVLEGFSKNVFAFFDYRILPFLLTLGVVAVAFLEPPLALAARALELPLGTFPTNLATLAVIESYILWQIAYRRFKFPAWLVFFYPLSLVLFILVGLRSLVMTLSGTATWKERELDRSAIRWM